MTSRIFPIRTPLRLCFHAFPQNVKIFKGLMAGKFENTPQATLAIAEHKKAFKDCNSFRHKFSFPNVMSHWNRDHEDNLHHHLGCLWGCPQPWSHPVEQHCHQTRDHCSHGRRCHGQPQWIQRWWYWGQHCCMSPPEPSLLFWLPIRCTTGHLNGFQGLSNNNTYNCSNRNRILGGSNRIRNQVFLNPSIMCPSCWVETLPERLLPPKTRKCLNVGRARNGLPNQPARLSSI